MRDLTRSLRSLPRLCQGDAARMREWLDDPRGVHLAACALAILAGGLCYGYTMGMWRSPLMGLLVALKIPLLVLLTLIVNGLINGMMAMVLGSGLGFRQTLMAMLMSFASFSLITGALAPVTLALAWSLAGPREHGSEDAYRVTVLVHTCCIAYAGYMGNRRFLPVILAASHTVGSGYRVFFTWLAGNLFVGTQLSWIFRPFFGQESNAVEFMRADWQRSNFYLTLAGHARDLWFSAGDILTAMFGIIAILVLVSTFHRKLIKPLTQNKKP